MRLLDRMEQARPGDPRRWEQPSRPAVGNARKGYDRCEKALADVVWTLQHQCPPATRQGLALMLRDLTSTNVEILSRDALIRLAAWAVNGAVRIDELIAARQR